jgi:hypothetical protein
MARPQRAHGGCVLLACPRVGWYKLSVERHGMACQRLACWEEDAHGPGEEVTADARAAGGRR